MSPSTFRIFLEIGNDQVVAVYTDSFCDCRRYFRKKGMSEIGQQQPDRICALGRQTAGNPIGLIVQFFGPAQHTLASGDANLSVITQSL